MSEASVEFILDGGTPFDSDDVDGGDISNETVLDGGHP